LNLVTDLRDISDTYTLD